MIPVDLADSHKIHSNIGRSPVASFCGQLGERQRASPERDNRQEARSRQEGWRVNKGLELIIHEFLEATHLIVSLACGFLCPLDATAPSGDDIVCEASTIRLD